MLRKEFGSLVLLSSDLVAAQRQLRHSTINLTASVYVENRRHAAPDIGSMLASGK
jgi:integrase